ncbi:MAG: SDR family oxidoreductase [Proteobacteria bacterium]|nr:SDR family oxidoreductase [Pseudomonadota bacterium]
MDLGLKDRVAVVTGGSAGIGKATVAALLADGAKVAFCARNTERIEAVLAEFQADYGDAVYAQACDVTDRGSVAALHDAVLKKFGAVDILINNAGRSRQSTYENTTDEEWMEELQLKYFSVLFPSQAFQPQLEASDCGAIVMVSSHLGREPGPGLVATSSARAGIQNLFRSMSRELAPKGIRVNSILLGIVESDQWRRRYDALNDKTRSYEEWIGGEGAKRGIPLGRFGQPHEPAAAVVFLASPVASYITGAALEVDGGTAHYV